MYYYSRFLSVFFTNFYKIKIIWIRSKNSPKYQEFLYSLILVLELFNSSIWFS